MKMKLASVIYIVLISFSVEVAKSYKILGLFGHPGKSHVDVFVALMKGLAEKGHEVTVLGYFPLSQPVKNYEDISLENTTRHVFEIMSVGDIINNSKSRLAKYAQFTLLHKFAQTSCENGLKSPQVQNLINSNRKFDLIISETFNSDCFLGFVDVFKAPLIGISSCSPPPWTHSRVGNPNNPSYVPTFLLGFSDKLTFFERVENTIFSTVGEFYFDKFTTTKDECFVQKYFKGHTIRPVHEIIKNTSLILTNTHYSLNLPKPSVPNVVEVGGIHIGKPNKLPEKLEKWVNESTEGVVYFSLGSVIKGHTFPEDKKQAFLRAFGRIPQRVLWKWENDTMPGKPDNVMIQKWMPQLDILCHPNVKAFISHGGLLGTTEAVHCGVPVIVMPQFGDQFTNAKALEANGGGVILHLYEATEEKVYNALKTVLHPDFRKKAKELSERFRDRPLPPLETAIYWVEYVARHKGARHMRTAAVDMPFYQYLLLDVIAFLAAVILLVLFIFYYTIKTILRCIFARNKNKIKTN